MIKKKYLIILSYGIIFTIVLVVIFNSKKNNNDISSIHIQDFKIILENRDIDAHKIIPKVTKLANTMCKYLPKK